MHSSSTARRNMVRAAIKKFSGNREHFSDLSHHTDRRSGGGSGSGGWDNLGKRQPNRTGGFIVDVTSESMRKSSWSTQKD
jgi:hypothetical protein